MKHTWVQTAAPSCLLRVQSPSVQPGAGHFGLEDGFLVGLLTLWKDFIASPFLGGRVLGIDLGSLYLRGRQRNHGAKSPAQHLHFLFLINIYFSQLKSGPYWSDRKRLKNISLCKAVSPQNGVCLCYFWFWLFETGSYDVGQAGLELTT